MNTKDPNIISKIVDEVEGEAAVKVQTVAPSNTQVDLPGGFIAKDGSLVKYAEVRELNGIDEEAISKSGSVGKALLTMLQRGLVSLGLEAATKEDLDNLLSGDRDAILIGIRRVTFGDVVDFGFPCPQCQTDLVVHLDLNKDVPYRTLQNPIEDRRFNYTSTSGVEIVVELPTGSTQKRLLENTDKTVAELNTILLTGCVQTINGIPSMGASSVLKLGMRDRDQIVTKILEKNSGPRLGEVKTACEACGEVVPMPLSLSDLFRL